jgi:hypothetical protein
MGYAGRLSTVSRVYHTQFLVVQSIRSSMGAKHKRKLKWDNTQWTDVSLLIWAFFLFPKRKKKKKMCFGHSSTRVVVVELLV